MNTPHLILKETFQSDYFVKIYFKACDADLTLEFFNFDYFYEDFKRNR